MEPLACDLCDTKHGINKVAAPKEELGALVYASSCPLKVHLTFDAVSI